jgi:hypothetical protein
MPGLNPVRIFCASSRRPASGPHAPPNQGSRVSGRPPRGWRRPAADPVGGADGRTRSEPGPPEDFRRSPRLGQRRRPRPRPRGLRRNATRRTAWSSSCCGTPSRAPVVMFCLRRGSPAPGRQGPYLCPGRLDVAGRPAHRRPGQAEQAVTGAAKRGRGRYGRADAGSPGDDLLPKEAGRRRTGRREPIWGSPDASVGGFGAS